MITFTEAQIMAWFTPLLWPFIRALALLMALPVFNRRAVPNRVKIGLALFMVIAMQPSLPEIPAISLDSRMVFMIVAQQILIGVTMGFAVRIIFACIEFAGEIIGMQMGLNFASFFDPVTASQSSVLTSFLAVLIGWFFLVMNGHLLIFYALSQSFTVFPVSTNPWEFLVELKPWEWGKQIFLLGFWISLPLVTILLLINIVVGVISKITGTMQVFSIGLPMTLFVGFLGLWFMIPYLERPFTVAFEQVLSKLQ